VSTIEAAGYAVTPYHVYVPTFGDWGFALARRGGPPPRPTMPPNAAPLRFLNQSVLDAATVFPADVRTRTLEPSTLEHPRVVEDMRHGYD
jgi:spermidine synthase